MACERLKQITSKMEKQRSNLHRSRRIASILTPYAAKAENLELKNTFGFSTVTTLIHTLCYQPFQHFLDIRLSFNGTEII